MTFGQNLLDTIGVLIGFISVMLLLSLLVTALVQATQSTIHLRARNLKKGIHALIDNILGGETKMNKEKAANILNARNLAIMKRSPVSYIDIKELKKAIGYAKLGLKDEQIKKLKSGINEIWVRLEKQLDKRFLFLIRLITIAWAVIIAFYFQISAPDLLHKLSIDPNLREQYVAAALNLTDEVGAKLIETKEYQDVSEEAILRLEKQYPELKENLEEVSGVGKDKDALLEELENVLEDEVTDNVGILKSYEEILDELYQEKRERNLEQVRAVTEMLGRFNINPWQYGTKFYFKEGILQWKNIIGILFTAVLLSFGAPFWFERLKDVIKLKDTLSKGIKPEEKNKKNKKSQNNQS